MKGSRMIRVIKRNGSIEHFNAYKLTGALWRVMDDVGVEFRHASDLCDAIRIYLERTRTTAISSAALFEMTVKVLRRVEMNASADAFETHRRLRDTKRKRLSIQHDNGKLSAWDKSWLAELTSRIWHLSPATARFIAGVVEVELPIDDQTVLQRWELIERLNAQVAAYGLADAVPVR